LFYHSLVYSIFSLVCSLLICLYVVSIISYFYYQLFSISRLHIPKFRLFDMLLVYSIFSLVCSLLICLYVVSIISYFY